MRSDLRFWGIVNNSKPMSDLDQETEAELARIHREWARLERWRLALENEHAAWREELLAEADRQGLGERLHANPGQGKPNGKPD